MGLLSSKIRREQLNPGDHIYTWRNGYSYSHHGIYVDDGKVIHLTRAPGLIIFSSSHESSPSDPSGEDRVVCCSIEEFLSGGDLYLYEYGVKTALFLIKRAGTCTRTTSDPPEDVLLRASILLEKGFGDYDLVKNNCEDFAIYCKTGLLKLGTINGTSEQIEFLFTISNVFFFTPSQFLPFGLVLVVSGLLYCGFRSTTDRYEVEKVAVEKFDLSNRRTVRMENGSTRTSLSALDYIVFIFCIFNIWFWSPASSILSWIRFLSLYCVLYGNISEILRNHRINLELGEYVAWIIWLLGYWFWSSESIIYFWTKLLCLYTVLSSSVTDPWRRSKLEDYIVYTFFIFNIWFWTPASSILLWIRFFSLYCVLYTIIFDILRKHRMNLELGECVAWIIWLLGYWFWSSESKIYFLTKLLCLYHFLSESVSDPLRQSKLKDYMAHTIWLLGLWYWNPESTLLLWIRLVCLHLIFFSLFSIPLFNNRFKFGRFFFACFVIQSAALFLGLDYIDYFLRITKSVFL